MTPQNVNEVVAMFPQFFSQAQADWAKFKVASAANLVSDPQRQVIIDYYWDFPKLWDGIRPHFEYGTPQSPASDADKAFASQVNRWVIRLRGEPEFESRLGILPVIIIIAGIAIAAAFGVAGIKWAQGYMEKQHNISAMVAATVQGKLDPAILHDAITKEQDKGFFGGIAGDLKTILIVGAVVVGLVMFGPQLVAALKKKN